MKQREMCWMNNIEQSEFTAWKPEFACYKKAKCEIQDDDDKCGWTKNKKLIVW